VSRKKNVGSANKSEDSRVLRTGPFFTRLKTIFFHTTQRDRNLVKKKFDFFILFIVAVLAETVSHTLNLLAQRHEYLSASSYSPLLNSREMSHSEDIYLQGAT
jgi:hypothetical protein